MSRMEYLKVKGDVEQIFPADMNYLNEQFVLARKKIKDFDIKKRCSVADELARFREVLDDYEKKVHGCQAFGEELLSRMNSGTAVLNRLIESDGSSGSHYRYLLSTLNQERAIVQILVDKSRRMVEGVGSLRDGLNKVEPDSEFDQFPFLENLAIVFSSMS